MAHKNAICQPRVISKAVKLFAGKSQSWLLAQGIPASALTDSAKATAVSPCFGWKVLAWEASQETNKQKEIGSLQAFNLVLIFEGEIFI